jgi:multiple sugar transport system permease protein
MASVAMTRTKTASNTSTSPRNRRRQLAGFLFVLPCVLFVCCFFLIPLVFTGWMSLNNWTIFGETHFIGFENYTNLTQDHVFISSFGFTTKYTLIACPLICLLGFLLALLMQQTRWGVGIFRTVFFLPVVIGLGSASYLWVWLYNDQSGAINALLLRLGLIHTPVLWFNTANMGLLAVVIMIIWKTSGFAMLLFLMGIQAIPAELYEAARVDGANYWMRLSRITLPLLRRTFALTLVLVVTGSYLAFDQFYIMTHGGPENQTVTIVQRIYQVAFIYFKLGYSASQAIVLLVVLLVISLAQLFILRGSPTE